MLRMGMLLVWLVVAGIAPGKAFAHASLVGSDPKDGSVVATAPMRFALTFDERVTLTSLRLTAPDGSPVTLGEAHMDGATILIAAPEGLSEGSYALSYRVVSADGHPVAGALIFSIGRVTGVAPKPSSSAWLAEAIWLMRLLTYIGLGFGAGGAAALALLDLAPLGIRMHPFIRISSAVGILGAAGGLGLQGLDLLGTGAGDLLTPRPWQTAMASSYGLTALMLIGSLSLVLVVGPPTGRRRIVAVLAWLAASLAPAFSGHASTAPAAFAAPAVFVHAATMSLWIGALAPLMALMRMPDAATGLARFSRIIPFPVALLLASGAALALVQVGSPERLVGTPYGRILLVKLGLVAALLGLALVNRLRLTKPALADAPQARRWLARVILAETAFAVLILGTVGLWRFTPPPRVIAAVAAAEPFYTHVHIGNAMADFVIEPARPGPVRITLMLRSADMSPISAKAVTVSLASASNRIEEFQRVAKAGPDAGSWTVDDAIIPTGGIWSITASVAVTDFDQLSFPGEIVISSHP